MQYTTKFRKATRIVFSCLMLSVLFGCKEEKMKGEKGPCECKDETLAEKTIKDEPAEIRFVGEDFGGYVIFLEDYKKGAFGMEPCNKDLPENFKVENLKVLVSGTYRLCSEQVTHCEVCRVAPPNYKLEMLSIQLK